ncbi:LacI family DNA-binding transcriptional regulator [Sulfitobacter alexandrii]|uniref:LacI family DNA-binding transcriptional regulator n=1 Tax=Sulfitobacter alexandrii TaxID=1917485 RepID=UPI0009F95AC1|nr:LacI family DNA-binding transcriptional regulator [Sulfitobacter alexandrii]
MMEMAKPKGRVRMEEVARVAGVSLATVSRVLRQPEKVSPGLREKVQEAAARLGYAPDPVAGSLAGARSALVGVVVPSLTNAFFAGTLEAMSEVLEKRGLQLMVGCHGYDPDSEEELVAALSGWRPSALVITGLGQGRGVLGHLSRSGCPVIGMWDTDGGFMDSTVGFSQARAGEMAAEALVEKGHRDVAFVGATLDRDSRARARARGFAARFKALTGREVACHDVAGRGPGEGGAALGTVLAGDTRITAIAFSGDMLAIGALFEAQRRGISVPGELALLGYGDLEIAGCSNPGISTIRPPAV